MTLIAYFDFLGFTQFIENNDLVYQQGIMKEIFMRIENALSNGVLIENQHHKVVNDIGKGKIRCVNFSDTVVFWTADISIESLNEFIETAHRFNVLCNNYLFPVRGNVLLGEMVHYDYRNQNDNGGLYNVNSLIGKGILTAHQKAESQNWAGTVIDQSILIQLENNNVNPDVFFEKYAKRYKVPYKENKENDTEFVLNLIDDNLNNESYKTFETNLYRNFSNHKKDINNDKVKEKLENTLLYFKSFII